MKNKAGSLLIIAIGACFICGCVTQTHQSIPSKNNLTEAQKKVSTDLLQLAGIINLPSGITRDALEQQMEKNHQLIWTDENGTITDEKSTSHALVYVYINTLDTPDLPLLKTKVWNITDTDPVNKLVVAWVDMNNLISLASLDSVQSVRTVTLPMTK